MSLPIMLLLLLQPRCQQSNTSHQALLVWSTGGEYRPSDC